MLGSSLKAVLHSELQGEQYVGAELSQIGCPQEGANLVIQSNPPVLLCQAGCAEGFAELGDRETKGGGVEWGCVQVANMTYFIRRLWKHEAGEDIAEYAVMLAVILVLVVGTIRLGRLQRKQRIFCRREFNPVTN